MRVRGYGRTQEVTKRANSAERKKMTSLFYKIVANFGECRRTVGNDAARVRLHIEGCDQGYVSVGSISAPIKEGVARLNLSVLADGEYSPTLHLPVGTVRLESIVKRGASVERTSCDAEMTRRLSLRLEALEERLAGLEQTCAEHELAIRGDAIFGCFE